MSRAARSRLLDRDPFGRVRSDAQLAKLVKGLGNSRSRPIKPFDSARDAARIQRAVERIARGSLDRLAGEGRSSHPEIDHLRRLLGA